MPLNELQLRWIHPHKDHSAGKFITSLPEVPLLKSLFAPSQRQPISLLSSNNMDLVLAVFELYTNKITQYTLYLASSVHHYACEIHTHCWCHGNLLIFSAAQYFTVWLYHILLDILFFKKNINLFIFGCIGS